VGGVSHRQPVGGSATANSQSHNYPFAKGFLRGTSGAPNSQKYNLPLRMCVYVMLCSTGKWFG
ncbi:MAG: hypothetical protein IKM64_01140, partial [Clostridia bacterium]|nr:hypothetical protein [Clostridia bacterium]